MTKRRDSIQSTRRSFLRGAFTASAVAAVPAAAYAATPEPAACPQDRIAAAMLEIEGALAELYPGAHISFRQHSGKANGAVVISAHHDPDMRLRYFFDDGSPLLAADAGAYRYKEARSS